MAVRMVQAQRLSYPSWPSRRWERRIDDFRLGSSTSFQAKAAHFHFSPDSGHIAASHRSATKSADARRGAAHGGELRQAAGGAAPKGMKLPQIKLERHLPELFSCAAP